LHNAPQAFADFAHEIARNAQMIASCWMLSTGSIATLAVAPDDRTRKFIVSMKTR
jgi:hypothetical protein